MQFATASLYPSFLDACMAGADVDTLIAYNTSGNILPGLAFLVNTGRTFDAMQVIARLPMMCPANFWQTVRFLNYFVEVHASPAWNAEIARHLSVNPHLGINMGPQPYGMA